MEVDQQTVVLWADGGVEVSIITPLLPLQIQTQLASSCRNQGSTMPAASLRVYSLRASSGLEKSYFLLKGKKKALFLKIIEAT